MQIKNTIKRPNVISGRFTFSENVAHFLPSANTSNLAFTAHGTTEKTHIAW